jgi:hypothetical protein
MRLTDRDKALLRGCAAHGLSDAGGKNGLWRRCWPAGRGRPDGRRCFTIIDNGWSVFAEIASASENSRMFLFGFKTLRKDLTNERPNTAPDIYSRYAIKLVSEESHAALLCSEISDERAL